MLNKCNFIFSKIVCLLSRSPLCGHSVSLVIDYLYMCQHSQQLHRHSVSLVNNYTDIQFLKISNYFFCLFFLLAFYFSKLKQFPVSCSCWLCWHDTRVVINYTDTCLHSHWLRWHSVRVVVDYADTISAQSLTMLTRCQQSLCSSWLRWHWC